MRTPDILDETQILSTKTKFKEFIEESTIWTDMKNELKIWHHLAGMEVDSAESLLEMGRIQGRREAVTEMLTLPERILIGLEQLESNDDGSGED